MHRLRKATKGGDRRQHDAIDELKRRIQLTALVNLTASVDARR